MSCIGNEVVEYASKNPIVDIVDAEDIVTKSVVLKVILFSFYLFPVNLFDEETRVLDSMHLMPILYEF